MSNTFYPIGNSRAVTAGNVTANITMSIQGTNAFQFDAYTTPIFVAVGAGVATHPATNGTVGNAVLIPVGQTKTLAFNTLGSATTANVVISFITTATDGTLYITPGVV